MFFFITIKNCTKALYYIIFLGVRWWMEGSAAKRGRHLRTAPKTGSTQEKTRSIGKEPSTAPIIGRI
jgi:hypothetical protein